MTVCNSTLSDEYISEVPLWHNFTFHHFGLFLTAVFGGIATIIGLTLIFLHATHYLKPYEQRHIIRILLLIPIYSVVSFLSYLEYRHAIYFDILEGCYEAFAIASFFTLLCHYIAPNLHDQKDYFRTLIPKNWFWGVFGLQLCTGGENRGPFRKPRSGLTWFNVIWLGVFQYCFIRVLFTIVAVIAQLNDVYCEESLSPVFAHVWVQVFEAVSVTVAMFCLIQFYIQLKGDLAEHKPFLKVLCIKLVIFFSFWQTIVISFLSSTHGPLQPTPTLAYPDIKVGIPSTLLCIEMAIFAVMHIFAFPWKPYSLKHSYSDPLTAPGTGYSTSGAYNTPGYGDELGGMKYQGGFMGVKALVDAFNPWDVVKASARAFRWLFVGARKRHEDVSYQKAGGDPAKLAFGENGSSVSVGGPTFAGTGEAATELRAQEGFGAGRRGRPREGAVEDDRAGLLAHPGRMGARVPSASPYRTADDSAAMGVGRPSYEDYGDVKAPPFHRPLASDEEDTAYHPATTAAAPYRPGYGPATSGPPAAGAGAGAQGISGGVHPAFRTSAEQTGEWDVFGGATGRGQPGRRRDEDDDDVVDDRPPPGYWGR